MPDDPALRRIPLRTTESRLARGTADAHHPALPCRGAAPSRTRHAATTAATTPTPAPAPAPGTALLLEVIAFER
ncbi:hypothetical protein ACT3SP_11510 [Brachybacterium sp. AOP43-C2-M15]|uniref:hypothetical protein n=1 Tax=Brachybacterium sp. AOP43-C2-M15 TaxID=3457661 RepID=UPI0040337FB3